MLVERDLPCFSGVILEPLKPGIIRIWGLHWRPPGVMAYVCSLRSRWDERFGTIFVFLRTVQADCGVVSVARKALLMCVLQINISFENHLDLENTHETTPSYNFLPVRHW